MHQLAHTNAYNNQGWTRPKLGARNSVLFSHVHLSHDLLILTCTGRELEQKQSSQRTNALIRDAGKPNSSKTCYITMIFRSLFVLHVIQQNENESIT